MEDSRRLKVFELEEILRRHRTWMRRGKAWNKTARDRARLLEHLASLGPAAPFGLSQALEK